MRICKFCKRQLNELDRTQGEWVRKYKDRPYSGYWIPLLVAPWVTAAEICQKFNDKPKQFFWNKVLGLPYVGEGNKVTPDVLFRNLTEEVNDQKNVIIGCDSGIKKHFVVGNRDGIFYYGKTEDWDDIRGLLRRFTRSIAVIDALPDITEPRKLRQEFPGRVFLAHYARDRKTFQLVRWGQDKEAGAVTIDRNRLLQVLIDEFADQRIPLQGNRDDWQEYLSHWLTLYRTMEEDVMGIPQIVWNTSTGMDHWCHATVFWRAGLDRFGSRGAKILSGTLNKEIEETIPTGVEINPDGTHTLDLTKRFIKGEELDYTKRDDWRNT